MICTAGRKKPAAALIKAGKRELRITMSDCALCADCAGKSGEPCRNEKEARPAFHSVGIDVMGTVKKLGLPLKALREPEEEQNWYAAVWLN